ncbi:hypothetical protein AADW59_00360 [Candidatus Hodgkinia cicadicola]
MLIFAISGGKKSVFLNIKLCSMCKLVVSYVDVLFRPFSARACVWHNDFYAILLWIKREFGGLAVVFASANVWYRGIGKSLRYLKFSFYSTLRFPYAARLFNRIGLSALDSEYKLLVGKPLCSLDKRDTSDVGQFCLVHDCVFKLCCHGVATSCEFKLVRPNQFTAIKCTKRSLFRVFFRHTSNYTRRITRFVLCGVFLGKGVLWDLGSGTGCVSLSWYCREGHTAICFERNEFKLKLSVYNAHLMSQLLKKESVKFFKNYSECLVGVNLPNKLFFGCGLRRLWNWRLAYVHLRFGGCAVVVSVSNSGCVCIGLLSASYDSRSYLLSVHKLEVRLNAKLYTLCSSVFMCIIYKKHVNVW